jgi:hypothetical protein
MDLKPCHAGDWIAGFVAAEGSFTGGGETPSFTFAISLGATDGAICAHVRSFFGVGHVYEYPRRRKHHDDVVTFQVRSMPDLIEVIVPFMDEHLPPSHKRRQYLEWGGRLLGYWESRAKRVRPCTVNGCDSPRRAHGYCRHHLYRFMKQ